MKVPVIMLMTWSQKKRPSYTIRAGLNRSIITGAKHTKNDYYQHTIDLFELSILNNSSIKNKCKIKNIQLSLELISRNHLCHIQKCDNVLLFCNLLLVMLIIYTTIGISIAKWIMNDIMFAKANPLAWYIGISSHDDAINTTPQIILTSNIGNF